MEKRYEIKTSGIAIVDTNLDPKKVYHFTNEQWEFAQRFLKVACLEDRSGCVKFLREQFILSLPEGMALYDAAKEEITW